MRIEELISETAILSKSSTTTTSVIPLLQSGSPLIAFPDKALSSSFVSTTSQLSYPSLSICNTPNPLFLLPCASKNDGEKLAFELARKLGIELFSLIPSAMIGSEASVPLNVSYNVLKLILNKQIPVDTKITLNWIDVKDVAEGCYLAAQKGRSGERYILANEQCMTITDTTKLADQLYPDLQLKVPGAVPKFILYAIAGIMELSSKMSGKAPVLTRKDIAMLSGLQQNFDISKSRNELGFAPKSPAKAVQEALEYLMKHPELLKQA
jgi:dihydroflavonol-4-reductase